MSTLGPEGSGAASSNKRLQQTQAQVDEVVDIMRVNVDKVLERDQKLSELDDRADALQAGASQFETSAAKLKRKYWWKNCKMWAILIAVIVIIIVIIISEYQDIQKKKKSELLVFLCQLIKKSVKSAYFYVVLDPFLLLFFFLKHSYKLRLNNYV
uniref:Vesicle associated membrane protein 3 n=1 Tax=Oryzias latipes TaxID=8090 RepID=A0A3P9MBA1_ORYLA